MGTATRPAGEPFLDGETLSADELEQSFDNIYDEFNGNIEDVNVKAGADINGSKLLDGSIANAKLTNDTVAKAKMNVDGTIVYGVQTSVAYATEALTTSWADVDNLTGVTLTPSDTGDIIELSLSVTCDGAATPEATVEWGFSVDGTDMTQPAGLMKISTALNEQSGTFIYSVAAATSGSGIVLKPRVRRTAAKALTLEYVINYTRTFTAKIIPIK